jgi:hypothetical protein
MFIESLIKRKASTTVELDGKKYVFNATETEPRHLCEVKDQTHIERFLSIKEGFREALGKTKEVKPQAPVTPSQPVTPVENVEPAANPIAPVETPVSETTPVVEAAPVSEATPAAPVETVTQQTPAPASTVINRDALLAEAKALKIKSAHLFGNEKLAAAVAAAKAKV